jgi:phage protein D
VRPEPPRAANNKPKFTGLQRTFIPAQNFDRENRSFNWGQHSVHDGLSDDGSTTQTARDFSPRVYNLVMARGWESKSVEEQQSAASRQVESKQRLTPQEAAQKQEREAIELSRRRVLQQLQAVQNPRHRQMLESALAELNGRLERRG